jgi:dienelactone hydrolase
MEEVMSSSILSFTAAVFALGASSHALTREARPEILVQPLGASLVGEPVSVTVHGLKPREVVRLEALSRDRAGRPLRSWAELAAREDGGLDLAKEAPIAGTWSGADASGPFWSMAAIDGATPVDGDPDAIEVTFRLLRGANEIATATITRRWAAPDIAGIDVREGGVVGSFHSPAGSGPHPALILLGGSTGGIEWQRDQARLLASHGFATLAVAYFGMPGLPGALDGIPLEYFEKALAWMRSRKEVDPDRLALCGMSKGAELALLLASRTPSVRAVVAWVPGSHVFQSINRAANWPLTSSWTFGGKPLPFVPYSAEDMKRNIPLSDLYRLSLEKQGNESALIPVERVLGPVLLLSARADSIWPSTAMSESIVKTLQAAGHLHAVIHVAYDEADHGIGGPGWAPVPERVQSGTRAGLARARADGWSRVIPFLKTALGRP